MKLRRPRAVLFDWDNTLVDSFEVIHIAINEARTAFGLTPWRYDETCRRVAKSLRDSFPAIFGERWRDASETFYAAYAAHHLEYVRPLPGAGDLLDALHAAGVYLGVVSNKSGLYLRREVAHLGWAPYFGRVVGAADAAADKPSRAAVDLALAGSGVAAGREVWFVGDHALDVDCAMAAGCVAIVIRGAVPTGDEAALAKARWRFDDRAELSTIVRQL